jgi:hypothetical protein
MTHMSTGRRLAVVALLGGTLGAGTLGLAQSSGRPTTVAVRRGVFVRSVRVAGTVEAVRAATVIVPRMVGQTTPSLVLTRLVPGGSRVHPGDMLVEFDRQDQTRAAFDRRAEYLGLEEQIRKRRAELAAARAADETALTQAENDVARARLDVTKNRMLPRVEAEKNELALEEAGARFAQLGATFELKRRAAEAELRMLEIRRDRARNAMRHAEENVRRMTVHAPFEGLAVLKSVFKGSQMAEVQEGDELRPGVPVLDVVDPSEMRVRVRIGQADGGFVAVGQAARVLLDAYPDLAFDGRVEQVAPLAVPSSLTPKVRVFVATISIAGAHPNLMPDLSAAADIAVERQDSVLLLPRDAVAVDPGGAWVRLSRGRSFERQAIVTGSASADLVVVASGLADGAVVARRAREGS